MIVGMTGGRPKRLPWGTNENDPRCARLKLKLEEVAIGLIDEGATEFVCGMALGCDTYFAEILLDLKARRGITVIAALSCAEQSSPWNRADKDRFRRIISRCDDCVFGEVRLISSARTIWLAHTEGCEKRRNQLIVDKSDVLIAVYGGAKRSGTAQTISCAERKGIPIIVINPYDFG